MEVYHNLPPEGSHCTLIRYHKCYYYCALLLIFYKFVIKQEWMLPWQILTIGFFFFFRFFTCYGAFLCILCASRITCKVPTLVSVKQVRLFWVSCQCLERAMKFSFNEFHLWHQLGLSLMAAGKVSSFLLLYQPHHAQWTRPSLTIYWTLGHPDFLLHGWNDRTSTTLNAFINFR